MIEAPDALIRAKGLQSDADLQTPPRVADGCTALPRAKAALRNASQRPRQQLIVLHVGGVLLKMTFQLNIPRARQVSSNVRTPRHHRQSLTPSHVGPMQPFPLAVENTAGQHMCQSCVKLLQIGALDQSLVVIQFLQFRLVSVFQHPEEVLQRHLWTQGEDQRRRKWNEPDPAKRSETPPRLNTGPRLLNRDLVGIAEANRRRQFRRQLLGSQGQRLELRQFQNPRRGTAHGSTLAFTFSQRN